MSTRTALLLASAALLAAASPALAQDNRYGALPDIEDIAWEEGREVVQEIDEADVAADAAANARGWRIADRAEHAAMPQHRGEGAMQHRETTPRLAYTPAEREDWLADCRIVMRGDDFEDDDYGYDDDDDRRGGLLGGLLGAVAGGVAGNRIAGRGDRLGGTLIGAGVGGIAGAVIGDALDDDDRDHRDSRRYRADDEDAWAADYCEAYLRRYEASGHAGYGQMAYAHVQPVMLVSTGSHHQGAMREVITEEWVEVEQAEHRPHRGTIRRRAAPQRGKLTPTD